MTKDPIVQEVRDIRYQIEKECQQDPEKYYKHLKSVQERFSDRLVCRKPNPLPVVKQKTG
jgi:hypothetical protein